MEDRFRIRKAEGKTFIFDLIRRKEVVLTPEEWVRQQILYYLVHELQYPPALISVEKQIRVGSRNRRYDIVVYRNDAPWLIIECKAEDGVLNDKVLSQLLAYNSTLRVAYLCITNGHQIFTFDVKHRKWEASLPVYHP
ncbi:MAG: hypothetical protein RIQ62_1288 [Bacteroidota bacterium]